jgi:hypothetical protein
VKGFQFVAMLTDFWRSHKQDVTRELIFIVPINGERMEFAATKINRGRKATEVVLRRIVT